MKREMVRGELTCDRARCNKSHIVLWLMQKHYCKQTLSNNCSSGIV